MERGAPTQSSSGLPSSLRIHFGRGERPHVFWISPETDVDGRRTTFKVLSKSYSDGRLDVLLLEEPDRGRRRPIARLAVPSDAPSGWLYQWITRVEDELGVRFSRYDLRRVDTPEQWRQTADRLGWLRGH